MSDVELTTTVSPLMAHAFAANAKGLNVGVDELLATLVADHLQGADLGALLEHASSSGRKRGGRKPGPKPTGPTLNKDGTPRKKMGPRKPKPNPDGLPIEMRTKGPAIAKLKIDAKIKEWAEARGLINCGQLTAFTVQQVCQSAKVKLATVADLQRRLMEQKLSLKGVKVA